MTASRGTSNHPVFVQCCANGHLSDIDFNEIYVRCPQCGKRQALASTKGENGASLLGPCRGYRLWLGNFSDDALACTDESNKPRYNSSIAPLWCPPWM